MFYPNETTYAIYPFIAGIMLIRRGVTVEDYSDFIAGKYGVKASARFGFGILRSKAIAKFSTDKNAI